MEKQRANKKINNLFILLSITLLIVFICFSFFYLRAQGQVTLDYDFSEPYDEHSQVLVSGEGYYLKDDIKNDYTVGQQINVEEETQDNEEDVPEDVQQEEKQEEKKDENQNQGLNPETKPEQKPQNETNNTAPQNQGASSDASNVAPSSNNSGDSSGGGDNSGEGDGGDNNQDDPDEPEAINKKPRIETSLIDNLTSDGEDIAFTVRGTDYKERLIDPYYYQIRLNGNLIYSTGQDGDGFVTYRNNEPLLDGINEISIYIVDIEGNEASESYIINADTSQDALQDKYVTLIVDGRILGLGIILSAEEAIYKDESAAHFVDRVLSLYGLNPVSNNNMYGYYLARISRPGLVGGAENIVVPQAVQELVGELDLSSVDPDGLGERYFNAYSGWIYLYNYQYMGVGLSNITLYDGDEIIICFTLANGAEYDGTWFNYGDW